MELILLTSFFIVGFLFFIAGKDDFGRKETKLIIEKIEKDIDNNDISSKEVVKTETETELKSN